MRISFAFLLVFATGVLTAQSTLTAEQQLEDLRVFEQSIRDVHPGLFWYNDSATVTQRFATIKENSMSERELRSFYADVLGFYANLGCGHSWMSMPYALRKRWEEGPYQLPLNLFNTQDEWYVTYNLSEQDLPTGSQLLAINGLSMKAIIDSLSHFTPTDGFIQTRKRRTAKQNLNYYYQSFISADSTFRVSVLLPDASEPQDLLLSGISKQTAEERFKNRYPDEQGYNPYAEMFSTTFEGGIATLKIKTFSTSWLKNYDVKYKKAIAQFFEKIQEQNIRKVILDLRDNGGGDDEAGALLCTYLIADEFRYFDRMEAVTKKFNYAGYSDSKAFNLKGKLLKKDKENPGLYTFNMHPPLKPQKPSKYAYDGPLVVLQDGGSFSTTADVASILYQNKRGYFIGEENGGGFYGNNSAMMYHIRLPHSQINYYIPVIRYYSAVDQPALFGRGVPANEEIFKSYEQFVADKDPGMEAAIAYLNKQAP